MGAYVDVEVSGIMSLSLNSVKTLIPGMVVLQGRRQCLCHIAVCTCIIVQESVYEVCAIVLVCKCVRF